MSDIAIRVENLGKLYRLGEVGTGTISHDLNRWWARLRGKEDPFARVGELNDRTKKGKGDYVWAVKDLNFEVKKGEVLGIIGRNGAGKSTLLKLLSKVTQPSEGKIRVNGRIASLLEVGTGFHPEMTGRENIFQNGAILGMTKKEIRSKFDEIVDFSGVERYIDTPVKRYSSGMYVRLAFAVAAHLEPEILIIDEVLAVGDAEFQKKCLGKMKDVSVNEGRTVLFVSHNMAAISKLCTQGILLTQGRVDYAGPTESVINFYNKQSNYHGNSILKDEGLIRNLFIEQKEDGLLISCTYKSPIPLQIPCLGFVISGIEGNKIFGTNPLYQPPDFQITPSSEGTVLCKIEYPKLLNGVYNLSVWFGDGTVDHEIIIDALQFEVSNMVIYVKETSVENSGPVSPVVSWNFS